MAGLLESDMDEIERTSLREITNYLNQFPWQRVVVLTLPNVDTSGTLRISPARLVKHFYPLFLSRLSHALKVPMRDFWVVEKGSQFGREHMNVFLSCDVEIPEELLRDTWRSISGALSWHADFDRCRDTSYWIKEITSFAANVYDFGGSVIYRRKPTLTQTKPKRMRKSDYNRARKRRRFRPQEGCFREQSAM